MVALVGTAANQVPTNQDLGTLAFQDRNSVSIEELSIGTNSPDAKLNVFQPVIGGTGYQNGIRLHSVSGIDSRWFEGGGSDMGIGTNSNHSFAIRTNNSAKLVIAAGGSATFAGAILFSQANPSILGSDTDGRLGLHSDGAASAGSEILLYGSAHGSVPHTHKFRNNNSDSVTIDGNQNVGIGAAPSTSQKLRVYSDSQNVVTKIERGGGSDALIEFANNSQTDTVLLGALGDNLLLRSDAGTIDFKTNNNATTTLQLLNNTYAAFSTWLGVGVNPPTKNLHVKGGTDTRTRTEESSGTFVDTTVINTGHYLDSVGAVPFTINKHTSGQPLHLNTNNTHAMTITSAQDVGIGTTSVLANSKFEIAGGAATTLPTVTITADAQTTGWRTRRTGGSHAQEWYVGIRQNDRHLDTYNNTDNTLATRLTTGGNFTTYGSIFGQNGSGNAVFGIDGNGGNIYLGGGNASTNNIIMQCTTGERARVTSGTRFGVGTSNPTAGIHTVTEGSNYTDGAYLLVESTNSSMGGNATFVGFKHAAAIDGAWVPLKIQAAGTEILKLSSAGGLYVGNGTSTYGNHDPFYGFTHDSNTGLDWKAADTAVMKTGGSERQIWHSNGNVEIGGSLGVGATPTQKLYVSSNISGHQPRIAIEGPSNGSSGLAMLLNGSYIWTMRTTSNPANNLDFYCDATSSSRVSFKQNGEVGIGTTGPAELLEIMGLGDTAIRIHKGNVGETRQGITGTAGSDANVYNTNTEKFDFRYTASGALSMTSGSSVMEIDKSGNVTAAGNITAYSMAAAKEDIATIPNPLDLVEKLRGVSFKWKDRDEDKKTLGFVYEEVEEAVPELARSNDEGKGSVMYQNTVALLVECIKELKQEINELKQGK